MELSDQCSTRLKANAWRMKWHFASRVLTYQKLLVAYAVQISEHDAVIGIQLAAVLHSRVVEM